MRSNTTIVLSAVMAGLGLVILVRTIIAGGGPLSLGMLIGLLLTAAGVLRIVVERRTR